MVAAESGDAKASERECFHKSSSLDRVSFTPTSPISLLQKALLSSMAKSRRLARSGSVQFLPRASSVFASDDPTKRVSWEVDREMLKGGLKVQIALRPGPVSIAAVIAVIIDVTMTFTRPCAGLA